MSTPEKKNGNAPPTNAPASVRGFIIFKRSLNCDTSILGLTCEYRYDVSSDNAASAAEPIANPFPIAAVVFPTESSLSVIFLTSGSSLAISLIPPALSAMGPYVSTDTVVETNESIPMAAIVTP